MVLLALLQRLWSSNGALSVLAPIRGLCGAISFLIGWSEFEYHYKTPPGLASRIGELNGNIDAIKRFYRRGRRRD